MERQMQRDGTSLALADIRAERVRQMHAEGWTEAHDDRHRSGELARAAASYALQSTLGNPDRSFEIDVGGGTQMFKRKFFTVGTINVSYLLWPWDGKWWKPTTPRRDLVKAAALIVAEIERLDRKAV
jgi:hypothetical protein